jgi:hypothetical protein
MACFIGVASYQMRAAERRRSDILRRCLHEWHYHISAGDKSKSRRTASLALLGLVSHAATSKD